MRGAAEFEDNESIGMVEVHGWIALRETYRAVDDENICQRFAGFF